MVILSKSLHVFFNDENLTALAKRKITTTLIFIQTSSELVAKISGLQFRQVLQIKESILTTYSSIVRKGSSCYEEFLCKGAIIPSGISAIDGLLNGGLMTGRIYELCGGTACGKSQVCLSVAAHFSHSYQHSVFYIDTIGDFSAYRLCNFLENKTDKVGEAMQRIQITQPATAYQLLNFLYALIKRINENKNNAARLIIIDSLAAIFLQFIGVNYKEGSSLLSTTSSVLQYIAVELHTVIIVTNLITNWPNSDSEEVKRPYLGKFWSHIPSVRLNMTKQQSSDILVAVTKSSGVTLESSVTIRINEDCIT